MAPLTRHFSHDGSFVINETYNEWMVNEATGQYAKLTGLFKIHFDKNGDVVRYEMPIVNCHLVGNVPPNQKEWNGTS